MEGLQCFFSCLPTHNDNPLQILAGVGGCTVSHEPAKSGDVLIIIIIIIIIIMITSMVYLVMHAWGSAAKH